MHRNCFEWDITKNKSNEKKHGIAFEDAILIFEDPYLLEKYDSKHSNDEDRFLALGSIYGILLVAVAYTDRKGKTRIISARRATKTEQRLYYDKINEYYGSKA
ncbi:BrnT family toxin [Treponema sp. HNW]|uniref:BrnT family toxin n=1 Tax=Treponema sp. HNW TaxID=3116654 RepID=UPI003D129C23